MAFLSAQFTAAAFNLHKTNAAKCVDDYILSLMRPSQTYYGRCISACLKGDSRHMMGERYVRFPMGQPVPVQSLRN
jgi:hypothetical protein